MTKKIVIFGKEGCRHCDTAKTVCELRSKNWEYRLLGVDYSLTELNRLAPSCKTFPAVFIDDKWIGGVDELIRELSNEQ